ESLKAVSKELETAPEDRGPVWLRGATLLVQGRYEQGLEALKSMPQEAFPHRRIAGYFMGLALFYCGRTNDAEILLNRFLSSKELADDSLLISVQAIIRSEEHTSELQ